MESSGAQAYLVNTGWNGTGKRISIKDTRAIIDAILDGSIERAAFKKLPYFDLAVPQSLPGADSGILNPQDTYADAGEWDKKAVHLAKMFVGNVNRFTDTNLGQSLVDAGPKL